MPHRLARRLSDLLPDSNPEEAEITCSHEDLAKMIGSSRQSVTGTLKDWERQGWLLQAYGRIRVLDPASLRSYFED